MATSLIKITIVKNVMIIVKPAKINLLNVQAVRMTTFSKTTDAYKLALMDYTYHQLQVHVKSAKHLVHLALPKNFALLVFLVFT